MFGRTLKLLPVLLALWLAMACRGGGGPAAGPCR
jgi:hypothetical protein